MPRCEKCKEYLPSDMCDVQPDEKHICHFCLKETNVLFGGDTVYVKQEVILDYRKFIDSLKENPSLATKITTMSVESAVNRIKKEA